MNYHKITPFDIANGPGVRVVLWVSGCEHHCPQCHNQNTWDKQSGKPFTDETMEELLDKLRSSHVQGITFSGGDPLASYNRDEVAKIIRRIRQELPEKDIWVYTGYTYETLYDHSEIAREIFSMADVLVDGPFIMAQYSIDLRWRGSANQRVIDLRNTTRDKIKLFCS